MCRNGLDFCVCGAEDPGWIDATLEQLFINMRNLTRRKTPLPKVWTDAEWGSLKVPALFLVGEHELIYSAEKAVRRLKRLAPRVTADIIPGAGHDLTVVTGGYGQSKDP
jgi:pimeloyl-ACP methyl ester carboxylesterase